MANVKKNIKPLISVDWTINDGETPFFDQTLFNNSGGYGVSVDTGVVKYTDLPQAQNDLILSGSIAILEFYNKSFGVSSVPSIQYATIPHGGQSIYDVSGTYISTRPLDTIKVLVVIPATHVDESVDPPTIWNFDDLPNKSSTITFGAYDEISIDTYNLKKRAKKVSKLLEKFDISAKDYEGRVYNFDFGQQATKVTSFAGLLGKLVTDNKFSYSNSESDLIMIGVDSAYSPLYAQINQGEDFENLDRRFKQFSSSQFVDSNTLFIYKYFNDIVQLATDAEVDSPSTVTSGTPSDWGAFLTKYIKHPKAIVSHTSKYVHQMKEEEGQDIKDEVKKLNENPVKTSKELEAEDDFFSNPLTKARFVAAQERSSEWVGDNVLGNIDGVITGINGLEDVYSEFLDKIGMTHILRAAIRCLMKRYAYEELADDIARQYREFKKFLRDMRAFTAGILDIIKIPVITLDDLIPTVDIMWDIVKTVVAAIIEAVFSALWDMLKQIVYQMLNECILGDPCKEGGGTFGDISIGNLLSKGGVSRTLGNIAKPAAEVAAQAAGGAALNTITGRGNPEGTLLNTNLDTNSSKFLSNISSKVSTEQMKTLTQPAVDPASGLVEAGYAGLSSSRIGKFFDEVSSTLTCGETMDIMNGKSGLGVQQIVKSIAAKDPILKELLSDKNKINDFFGTAGKLIDPEDLEEQVNELAQYFPDPTGCLFDKDDSEARCFYLKEKEAPDWFCNAQETTSRDRAKERIGQLAKMLEDPSKALNDVVPPIYCSYDPDTGKIIDGLIENDHPSFTFLMQRTINTAFGGVKRAFLHDVTKIANVLSLEVPDGVDVIERVVDGRKEQGAMLVRDTLPVETFRDPTNAETALFAVGLASVPPIPLGHAPGTKVKELEYRWPGEKRLMINPRFEMALQNGFKPDVPFWESPPWTIPKFPGTPSQGGLWTAFTDFFEATGEPSQATDLPTIYEHKANGRNRTIVWNYEKPPIRRPMTKIEFCPGMSGPNGIYSKFQTGYLMATPARILANDHARAELNVAGNTLQMSVDNPTKSELDQLGEEKSAFDIYMNEVEKNPILRNNLTAAGLGDMFGPDKYALTLTSFQNVPAGKDKYSVSIAGAFTNSPDVEIYKKMFITDIPQKANNVIVSRSLSGGGLAELSTKENQFIDLLRNIWIQGENIYTGSANNMGLTVKPSYGTGFAVSGLWGTFLQGKQNETEGIGTLYGELLRDLMASCLTQVKDSPFLANPDLFGLINMTPGPCENGVDRSLLGITNLMNDIMRRYRDSQCIENSLPNVTGLGDNRNNAFESAAIYGVVKTTARVYAIEAVLKTLVTFSELQLDDMGELFTGYIRDHLVGEVRAKGYLDEFISETLKAYNLEAATNNELVTGEKDFIVALDFFIKEGLEFAIKKLLRMSAVDEPQKSIDNLLTNAVYVGYLEKGWLPVLDAGLGVEDLTAMGFAERLEAFRQEAGPIDGLLGIKDWTNGSIILEKYIRVEATDFWQNTSQAQNISGVWTLDEFESKWAALFGPSGTPPDLDHSSFTSTIAGTSAITQSVTFGDDECEPERTVEQVIQGRADQQTDLTPPADKVSTYFKFMRWGLRLVVKTGDWKSQWKTSMETQLGDNVFGFVKGLKNKSYFIHDGGDHSNRRYAFPIVCVEIDNPIPDSYGLEDPYPEEFDPLVFNNFFPDLLQMLKKTDEYSFMFDYCFPLKRLVSLCALYNTAYTIPYPGMNNVFTHTKHQLRMVFMALLTSGNYQYTDPQQSQDNLANDSLGIGIPMATGIDMSDMFIKFLFGLFKGAGEAFSPNIAIAGKIKMAMRLIGPALVNAINEGKKMGSKLDKARGGDGNFEEMTVCDLPFEIPDIPMWMISLGLLPGDVFWGIPMPPLGPLGLAYLPFFGANGELGLGQTPGNKILGKTPTEQQRERCKIRDEGGPDLTGEDCEE